MFNDHGIRSRHILYGAALRLVVAIASREWSISSNNHSLPTYLYYVLLT